MLISLVQLAIFVSIWVCVFIQKYNVCIYSISPHGRVGTSVHIHICKHMHDLQHTKVRVCVPVRMGVHVSA